MTPLSGLIAASAFAVSAAVAGSCAACQPNIYEPAALLAFPAAKSAAVYFRIENICDRQILLSGAVSPSARRTELHFSEEAADGVVSMQPVEAAVPIGPGATLVFEPGGLHVMLMGLGSAADDDSEITLELSFDHADDVTLAVPVRIGP